MEDPDGCRYVLFRSQTSQRLRAESRAEDILILLRERGVGVPEDARKRIVYCHDPNTLRCWFRRAITAASVGQIFTQQRLDEGQGNRPQGRSSTEEPARIHEDKARLLRAQGYTGLEADVYATNYVEGYVEARAE